jgi:hypothetical protein
LVVVFKKIDLLSTPLVGFYSVALEGQELTEFEKFDAKDFSDPDHQKQLNIIRGIIQRMGLRMAKPWNFREEEDASALPGKGDVPRKFITKSKDFGIRLYCVRISDSIVILLNGDLKTHQKPKLCDRVRPHFNLAVQLAKKITSSIQLEEISWKGSRLSPLDIEIDI